MQVNTFFLRVPSKQIRFRQSHSITRRSLKAIARKLGFIHGNFWVWIVAHGPRLGVIVRRIQIQVPQVLGRVFSNAQVTSRHLHLSATDTTLSG